MLSRRLGIFYCFKVCLACNGPKCFLGRAIGCTLYIPNRIVRLKGRAGLICRCTCPQLRGSVSRSIPNTITHPWPLLLTFKCEHMQHLPANVAQLHILHMRCGCILLSVSNGFELWNLNFEFVDARQCKFTRHLVSRDSCSKFVEHYGVQNY